MLLLAFATTTAIQARRIASERDRASQHAEIAKAVNDFLQKDLLGEAAGEPQLGQIVGDNPYLTVREALDRAAARIDNRFQEIKPNPQPYCDNGQNNWTGHP